MKSFYFTALLLAIFIASVNYAQVPRTISYQGVLSDGHGRVTGDMKMTFRIYDSADANEPIWYNSKLVDITDGIFEVMLGKGKTLNLPFDKPYWLGIKVGGDEELSPRIPLTSVAYSFNAGGLAENVAVKSINQLKNNVTIQAGDNITVSSSDNAITISANGVSGSGSSLDQAYDKGNTINADAGSVHIDGDGGLTCEGSIGIGIKNPNEFTKLHVENSSYFAGFFESNYADANTKVIYSNYTGKGKYQATAVYGKSQPAEGYGYGGKFFGGYNGVYGSSDVFGVYGRTYDKNGHNYGVYGFAGLGSCNTGIQGYGKDGSMNYGVRGYAFNSSNNSYSYGVYGSAYGKGNKYAMYASGDLVCTGNFYKLSDRMFKQNIQPLNDALSSLMRLKVKSYTHIRDDKYDGFNLARGRHYGLIAQDLEAVFPEFVEEIAHPVAQDEESLVTDDVVKYKAIDYTELIPVLIKAVQEQQSQLDNQQQQIEDLRSLVSALQNN